SLVEVEVESAREKPINARQWFSVYQIAWLEDKSALIVCAKEDPLSPVQLWRVSYPDGQSVRITNDTAEYYTVSLPRDSATIVSVQGRQQGQVWLAPGGDADAAKSIASTIGRLYGHAVTWTNNG